MLKKQRNKNGTAIAAPEPLPKDFLDMIAPAAEAGKIIQNAANRLLLKQREAFLSANPAGRDRLGPQFERVLPTSSVANLYPNNYSGKTDPQGFYIGKDKYGSNIIVDLDRRADDKTNASVLILGNSGQGKSFLLKLLVTNLLESGKSVAGVWSGRGTIGLVEIKRRRASTKSAPPM